MSIVTVYATPGCVQCKATYRALAQQRIAYRVIDVTRDEQSRQRAAELGYQQAPVVIVDERTHWSGFQPDRIAQLAEQLHREADYDHQLQLDRAAYEHDHNERIER